MVDLSKIIKLLNMSTSNFDGECLAAVRRANAMLMEENMTWGDVFQSKQSTPILIPSMNSKENLQHMLTMCISRTHSKSGVEFLRSLQDFYRKRGFLTERQAEALHKWYKNI